jgi:hypothetical protein
MVTAQKDLKLAKLSHMIWEWIQADLVLLCFVLLHFTYISYSQIEGYGNPASSKSTDTIFSLALVIVSGFFLAIKYF